MAMIQPIVIEIDKKLESFVHSCRGLPEKVMMYDNKEWTHHSLNRDCLRLHFSHCI